MSLFRPSGLAAFAIASLLVADPALAKKKQPAKQPSTPAQVEPTAQPSAPVSAKASTTAPSPAALTSSTPAASSSTPAGAASTTPSAAPNAAVAPPAAPVAITVDRAPPPPDTGRRLGVGADFFGESNRLVGEHWINQTRQDESFDYGSGSFFSTTAWLLIPMNRFIRVGPGARIFGNYSSSGNNNFKFGFLSEAFAQGELSFRTFERFELVLGARAGLALLWPTTGSDFGREIDRLQQQGLGVFSGPRLGWVAGLGVGMRRKMWDWFHLRADLTGQHQELYLFATDQMVDGLRVQKWWRTGSWRFGLTLGAEVSL
ncbi:MAG: hypothetical protein ACT4TC_03745 [Myxococcaceae bacterium]